MIKPHAHKARSKAVRISSLVFFVLLLFIMRAIPSAHAEAVPDSLTIVVDGPYPSGIMDADGVNSHMFSQVGTNVTIYCADAYAATPAGKVTGATETFYNPQRGTLVLDYILYYGHGGSEDQGWSRAATQCAVWYELEDARNGLNTDPNEYFHMKQAAGKGYELFREACNNARSDGPYAGSSWIYGETPTSTSMTQRVIGQTLRYGHASLQKSSGDTDITNGNGSYTLAGAQYRIYNSGMSAIGTLTTDSNGNTGTIDGLSAGTYYAEEISAPRGYKRDTARHSITVKIGETSTFYVTDYAKYGRVTVSKTDSLSNEPVRQAGFVFKLSNGSYSSTLTTDDSGTVTFDRIPFGSYTINEVTAPSPYLLNGTSYSVTLNETNDDVTVKTQSVADAMPYGNVSVTKSCSVSGTSADGTKAPNVKYGIYASETIDRGDANRTVIYKKDEKIGEIITGTDGVATYDATKNNNRYLYIGADGNGKYRVTEESVPTSLVIERTPIEFTLTYKNQNTQNLGTANLTKSNNVAYGQAKIMKNDNILHEAIPDVEYDVVAQEDVNLWNSTIYKKGQVIDHVKTDSNGVAKTSDNVKLYIGITGSSKYAFIETKVPTAVLLNKAPVVFTISYQNQDVENVGFVSVNQTNNIVYGKAKIKKQDNIISSAIPYAEYDVIAQEDITLWNGHRIYKKNQIIEHVITGQDGVASTYERYYVGSDGDGKYAFIETNVKAPLIINKTPIPFTITYKDENTEVLDTQQVNQVNDVPYAPAEITKTDNVLNSGVPGVEYDIKAVENINLWNGKIYTKNQVIGHVTTDSNGVAKTDDSIKLYPGMTGIGRYAFIETKVPVGLTIDSTPIVFTIRYKNQEDSSLSTQRVSQADAVVYGGASIRKTETTNGTNISGAKFNVVADEDIVLWNGKTIYRKNDVVDQITSNSDGVAITSKPLYVGSSGVGHYRFVETFTPCPYFNDRVDVPFTVNYVDNKTENVRIEKSAQKEKGNDIQRREVHFSKTDFSSGAPVAGAVFELSANEDVRTQSGSVVYRKDEVIGTYTTDEDGFIYVKDGKILVDASGECSYKFVEVKAPAGYVLDSTPANFTVKYVGQDVNVQYGDAISVTNKPNAFKLTKTVASKDIDSEVTDTTVPNATFRLWNKSDELNISPKDNSHIAYALRIDNGDMNHKVDIISSSGNEITIVNKDNAFVATDLIQNDIYDIKVDGQSVYTLYTDTAHNVEAGSRIYGRYNSNAVEYAYKRQPILLTSDSKFIDKFTINGKDYPVQTKVNTNGNITINRIVPGAYGFGEVDVPISDDKTKTFLVDTNIFYFDVDETTGQINGKSDETADFENDYTNVEMSKTDMSGSDEIPGATLEVRDSNDNVMDKWISTDAPHIITKLAPGKYTLTELLTPNNYDQATRISFNVYDTGDIQKVTMTDSPIKIGAQIDKRQEIAIPTANNALVDDSGVNKADANGKKNGEYSYSIDYHSTSNTWTDEFTVTDSLDGVNDGLARLDSIVTARSWQDYDGKMNVWYQTNKTQTNKTLDTDTSESAKANATLEDGHTNSWLSDESTISKFGDDRRAINYSGWELWAKDIPTTVATTLNVNELNLESDEYVTAIRFEYGRVESDFTTRISAWDRDNLKDSHDDVDAIEYIHRETFDTDNNLTSIKSIVSALAEMLNDDKDDVFNMTDEDSSNIKKIIGIVTENENANDSHDVSNEINNMTDIILAKTDSIDITKITNISAMEKLAESIKNAYTKINVLVPEAENDNLNEALATFLEASQDNKSDEIEKDWEAVIESENEIMRTIAKNTASNNSNVNYSPAIINMHVTDNYVPGTILNNTAKVDAYRNGGGTDLEGHDDDGVTQKPVESPKTENSTPIVDLVQTGIDNILYIGIIISAISILIVTRRVKKNN